MVQCLRPANYFAASELSGTNNDCNDNEPTMYPGNPEICDGLDNDCNGQVDDGVCVGYTCTTPFSIGSLPYTNSGTTNGTGDDYDQNDACGSNFMTGDDVVFTYTSAGNEVIRIKLEKTGGPVGNDWSAHAVFLLDGCPDDPGANCLYTQTHTPSTSVNDPIYIETGFLPSAGTYYIVVSSYSAYHQWFDFTITVDQPSGNICENANNIGSLPFTFNGSTNLLGDDYDNTDACSSLYMGGNDVVFTYTSSGNEVIRIKLEKTGGPAGNNWSAHAVFVLDDCPDDPATNCLYTQIHTASTSSNEPIYIETVHFTTAGTYYIVVASHPAYHQWFDFTITVDQPSGNICENANNIGSLPFTFNGSTNLLGDDYDNTDACSSLYMGGNDVVFTYTSSGNEVIRIKLEKTGGPAGNNWSAHAVFVLDDCPDDPATNCLYTQIHTASTSSNEPIYIETVHFTTAGTYYIVVASHPAYHQWFDFTLTVDLPIGNLCENATTISSLPYFATGETTCLLGDDYSSSGPCSSNYIDGNDHVYKFTPASSGAIDIQLSNLSADHTGIHFSDDCPNNGMAVCTTLVNNSASNYIFENIAVTAGVDYYITIASNPAFTSCFNYDIAVGEAGFLPVELISFTASKLDEKSVELKWETATEQNVSHFEIERSRDGINWEYRSFKQANGNTRQPQLYSYTDQVVAVSRGYLYYRLRIVDNDGSFDLSPVRSVNYQGSEDAFFVYPNPSSGRFFVSLPPNMDEPFDLVLYDLNGKILIKKIASASVDSPLPIGEGENVPDGVYYLQIKQGSRTVWRDKLIILQK